jgi:hypothetical protein
MESTFQKVCLKEIDSVLGSLGHTPEAGHSVGGEKKKEKFNKKK